MTIETPMIIKVIILPDLNLVTLGVILSLDVSHKIRDPTLLNRLSISGKQARFSPHAKPESI